MAARGSASKEVIIEKILSTFEGSFKYDKEIRIPMVEDGELIQIKVSLTCAKNNVEVDSETTPNNSNSVKKVNPVEKNVPREPSEEEKQILSDLLLKVGM